MRIPSKFLTAKFPPAKFLTATVIAALSAGSAHAECFNEFESVFGLSDTMFTLVLKGNIVSSINTSAMVGDTTVNPFAYVDTKILHVANTSTVKATFNGTNTVATFTGNNSIKSTYTFNYGGSGNGKPHFGLDPSSSTGGGSRD
jgi:hypothetical protein